MHIWEKHDRLYLVYQYIHKYINVRFGQIGFSGLLTAFNRPIINRNIKRELLGTKQWRRLKSRVAFNLQSNNLTRRDKFLTVGVIATICIGYSSKLPIEVGT